MKFLNRYFDDSISLEDLKKDYVIYEKYLESIKSNFDEETYKILNSGSFQDYKVESIHIDNSVDKDFNHRSMIIMILYGIENKYEIIYKDVSYMSLSKQFDLEVGFDDILIAECILEDDLFIHELVFVGEVPWIIKSKEISIREID
jgi:hypothetical protein